MRLEARTTAGAKTPSEAKPRRNRRRGTTREPIVGNPRVLLMSTRRQLHSANADADDRARGSLLFLGRSTGNYNSILRPRGHPKSGELRAPILNYTQPAVLFWRRPCPDLHGSIGNLSTAASFHLD